MTGTLPALLRAAVMAAGALIIARVPAQDVLQVPRQFQRRRAISIRRDSAIGAIPPPEEFGLNAGVM
jgi:hypothetical protein